MRCITVSKSPRGPRSVRNGLDWKMLINLAKFVQLNVDRCGIIPKTGSSRHIAAPILGSNECAYDTAASGVAGEQFRPGEVRPVELGLLRGDHRTPARTRS